MTARPLPFFKRKLMDIARELYLENGWKMPRGFENAAERDPTNFTLAEWQQAKRQGIDPRWLKQTIQECWSRSDGVKAFASSLEERGFFLAKGDRRSHVIIDHSGEIYSLPRTLGLKSKEVRARLGSGEELQAVAAVQKKIGERMTPAIRRHIEESRVEFRASSARLGHQKMEMTHRHRAARAELENRQSTEWDKETRERSGRLPRGLRGIWFRITGRYGQMRDENEREAKRTRVRQEAERQGLINDQLAERRMLQQQFKELRTRQAKQLLQLRREVGHFLSLARVDQLAPAPHRGRSRDLELER
jgi:hypothetical protein